MSITFPIPFDESLPDQEFRDSVFSLFNDIYTVQLEGESLPVPINAQVEEMDFRNQVESVFTDLYSEKFKQSFPLPFNKDCDIVEWRS